MTGENPIPTRQQIAAVAGGDERLIRAFESLFSNVTVLSEDTGESLNFGIGSGLTSQVSTKQSAIRSIENGDIVFISDLYDFPRPVSGVITLEAGVTYCVTSQVDLSGARLQCVGSTLICGMDRSVSSLKSTGLVDPLITGTGAVNLRDITITATTAVSLSSSDPSFFIVWSGVNFDDCNDVGVISGYNSVVMSFCGMSNSAGLVFDGTIGTISIDDMFIFGRAGQTSISLPSTAVINRRIRVRFSSIITPSGGVGVDVDLGATIPGESYILLDVNFSGAGTYVSGVPFDDNRAMFTSNIGILNSRAFAQYYMSGNTVPTPVTVSTPTKVEGVTTENTINQRFTHTDNRVTYTGTITRDFEVDARAALSSGNNNTLRLYIAVNGVAITAVYGEGTANAGGRAEGITTADVVELSTGDYVEVFVSNETGGNDVTDINLNVIVSEL